MTKSSSLKLFLCIMAIASIIMGLFQLPSCRHTDPKELAKINRCPYEFGECPNAQEMHYEDSLAYADAEFVSDSLAGRVIQLETQLAACELKDHGKIPDTAGVGMIHMRHDPDGAIQLVYREHNGHEYFLEYAVDDFLSINK